MKIRTLKINGRDVGRVAVCDNYFLRLRGLIGHEFIRDGFDALVLIPCKQIHTFFMCYTIDVAYVDKDNRIVHMDIKAEPYKLYKYIKVAAMTVEFPAGFIEKNKISAGDICIIE